MTALEVYDLTTKGGGTDFRKIIGSCESLGPYCLIGGLAVNCYVEPVYTLDADIAIISEHLPALSLSSQLRIQFTTDPRYQDFPLRSSQREVLGAMIEVACLDDVVQGKLWAYADPKRRLSKRKKDELDLIRLAEAYPWLKQRYPDDLAHQLSAL